MWSDQRENEGPKRKWKEVAKEPGEKWVEIGVIDLREGEEQCTDEWLSTGDTRFRHGNKDLIGIFFLKTGELLTYLNLMGGAIL